jgi:hypothetical protein
MGQYNFGGLNQMSLFCTPYVSSVSSQTGNYTVPSSVDLVPFLVTAAKTATLPSTTGLFGGQVLANRQGGQGVVYIQNSASSTANVTIAAGSGDSLVGNSVVAPGQVTECTSDGAGNWYLAPFGSQAGGSQVQTAVVPLTSAQILALNTTPVSLIAAPGAGKAIRVMDLALKMTTTSTVYANGGALEFRYTDGSGTKVTADIASAVVTAGAGTSYTNVEGIEVSLTLTANAAVVVRAASADFITGTGAGIFYVSYRVIG